MELIRLMPDISVKNSLAGVGSHDRIFPDKLYSKIFFRSGRGRLVYRGKHFGAHSEVSRRASFADKMKYELRKAYAHKTHV